MRAKVPQASTLTPGQKRRQMTQGRIQRFCSEEAKPRSLSCSLSQVTASNVSMLPKALGMVRRLASNCVEVSVTTMQFDGCHPLD